jgi:AraC family transcriptional regulator
MTATQGSSPCISLRRFAAVPNPWEDKETLGRGRPNEVHSTDNSNENDLGVAPPSQALERSHPGRKVFCSTTADWSSLLVQIYESPGIVESFDTPALSDHVISLASKGQGEISRFAQGAWKRARYGVGLVNITPGGVQNRLRWHAESATSLESLILVVPAEVFRGVQEEYRRVRAHCPPLVPQVIGHCDPALSSVLLSLPTAIARGAPNLYAESVAQFLAKHVLSSQKLLPDPNVDRRSGGTLRNRRLTRVLDYMHTHFMDSLNLNELSREACVSRFHFVKAFRKSMGVTPHKYLVRLRMEMAARLLAETDHSVVEIALSCAYRSSAHFGAAFHHHFAQPPAAYRKMSRLGLL